MKTIVYLITALVLTACNTQNKNFNKVAIQHTSDSIKNVVAEITYTDTLLFEVPYDIPDSLILESIKATSEALRNDSIRRDSLHRINFRRITKIINGGYNGYAEREKLWNKAKQVLHEKENSK